MLSRARLIDVREERYGARDQTYSAWHRRLSTRRYVGIERAQLLSMIDLDACMFVEYDDGTREPLALIETARDVGQPTKAATVTATLARLARIPAFCVLYRCAERPNPADPRWPDVVEFRIRRLWPSPDSVWRTVSPSEWAMALLALRVRSCWKLDDAQSQADYAALRWSDSDIVGTAYASPQLELLQA
jgi:hypothetical protein